MSNQYQELYKVGDIVRDKVKDRVGTVKAVEDFRGPNGHITKQIVVFNAGSTPRDYVAVEVPRLIRGNSDARSPLERLGVPPRLSLGDEVLHNGQRWRVHEVLPHGAVKVGTTSGSMTLQWPTYRKAKKDKGGLGKFRRGDLVRVVGEPEYAWKAVVGIEREGDRTALRIDNGLRLHPSLFSRLERKEKPPLIPTSESALKAAQSFLEKPVSHARVEGLENVFDLIKRFYAEKDPNQAGFLVGKVIEGVINLNPAIHVDALVTTYDRRFLAEAKEVVNAHS